MLLLRAGGIDFEKSITELDPDEAFAGLSVLSEIALMVRDDRRTSDNPDAERYYNQFFVNVSDA